jgi:TRAP-type C4-dicarboxylate transport system permease small subunit
MIRLLDRIDNAMAVAERTLLMVLLAGMIGLAFIQVVMRNLFSSGFGWADIAVRHLVLWVGLLGASIAAKENRHLSIDIVSRLISRRSQHALEAFLSLVTAAVCSMFLWASFLFSRFLYEWGTGTMGGVPALLACSILPLAFGGMAFRYLVRAIHEVIELHEKKEPDGGSD